jgi:hypothetical protein
MQTNISNKDNAIKGGLTDQELVDMLLSDGEGPDAARKALFYNNSLGKADKAYHAYPKSEEGADLAVFLNDSPEFPKCDNMSSNEIIREDFRNMSITPLVENLGADRSYYGKPWAVAEEDLRGCGILDERRSKAVRLLI